MKHLFDLKTLFFNINLSHISEFKSVMNNYDLLWNIIKKKSQLEIQIQIRTRQDW